MGITDNFVPKAFLITNVTNEVRANVTTNADHSYFTGQIVRIIVPLAYGMNLNYVQTAITVTGSNTFQTEIDTTGQAAFVTPTFPPAFTSAQVTPISGVEDNIAP